MKRTVLWMEDEKKEIAIIIKNLTKEQFEKLKDYLHILINKE